MNKPDQSKKEMRNLLRELLLGISEIDRVDLSRKVYALLQRQDVWQSSKSILLFAPHSNEPDIWPLMAVALGQEKLIALPKFAADKNSYIACRIENLERSFLRGQFGIREPNTECTEIPPNQLDLALVPGVGFDLKGGRLGRGRGFYDRLLAQIPGSKCGVCFDEQIVETIPTEPHDVRMNYILTPTRWHEVKPA